MQCPYSKLPFRTLWLGLDCHKILVNGPTFPGVSHIREVKGWEDSQEAVFANIWLEVSREPGLAKRFIESSQLRSSRKKRKRLVIQVVLRLQCLHQVVGDSLFIIVLIKESRL
jgi:hypothetical protein